MSHCFPHCPSLSPSLLCLASGAFTPGCSNTHLPSFLKDFDRIKGKGVDKIVCLSVNDAFVMHGTHHPPHPLTHSASLRSLDLAIFCHSSPLSPSLSSLSPSAWQEDTKSTGKIRFFADATGELAKALGLDFNAPPLGGVRMKRFSALLVDGKVDQINVEPDSTGTTCSLAPHLKL